MDDKLIIDLIQRQQGQVIDLANTVHDLRAKANRLEAATNEMVVARAEAEPAIRALDEIQAYLEEKVRMERNACVEPGMYARTPLGNSVALTLYADLANMLHKIRTGYGL